MNILAFDTSGKVCTIALYFNNSLYFRISTTEKNHSANLFPLIDEVFHEANTTIQEMDYLCVVAGPGSFTGVRIGIAAAKGLAQGLKKPCIVLNTLDVLCKENIEPNTLVCPILDARAKQVYTCAKLNSKDGSHAIVEPRAIALQSLLEKIKNYNKLYFCGDGVPVYKEYIASIIPNAQFSDTSNISPHLLINSALENINNALPYNKILPIYLRAPQAERMLLEGKLKTNG